MSTSTVTGKRGRDNLPETQFLTPPPFKRSKTDGAYSPKAVDPEKTEEAANRTKTRWGAPLSKSSAGAGELTPTVKPTEENTLKERSTRWGPALNKETANATSAAAKTLPQPAFKSVPFSFHAAPSLSSSSQSSQQHSQKPKQTAGAASKNMPGKEASTVDFDILGDQQFLAFEFKEAAESYRKALELRPFNTFIKGKISRALHLLRTQTNAQR